MDHPTASSLPAAAVLAFEREWWTWVGARETAVHEHFGVSVQDYLRRLDALLDDPETLTQDPRLVRRLRRLRSTRRRERAGRRPLDTPDRARG